MQIELLNSNARAPIRSSAGAAGFDLFACENGHVPARFDIKKMLLVLPFIAFLEMNGVSATNILLMTVSYIVFTGVVAPTTIVPTGVCLAVPHGTYGRVAPRSGLAAKHSIGVGAGVIDADYRGEVKVVLFNHGVFAYYFKRGDRIAQLVVESIALESDVTVGAFDDTTVRSKKGFGSTGR